MTEQQQNRPIVGIELEGFQVFDKPTYIPLEKITFLFGPNSAGKSSIQDAIDLHQVLLNRLLKYSPASESVQRL